MLASKALIVKIRTSFLDMAQNDTNRFHPNDVQKIKDNDWSIERFALVSKTEEAALKALVNAMEWRKTFGVNDFTDDYFPEEIYKIGFLNLGLKDKEGRPVLWTRITSYLKSDLSQLLKQFTVYCYEKLDSQTSNQGWIILSDTTGGGLSNIDMDYCKFMIDVLQNYYPRGPIAMSIINMPLILSATAKLVMAFMNEELKSIVEFIKKDELTKYLPIESIPVHLNGSNDKDLVVIPNGVKPLEDLTHTKFTDEQIKKIRNTFKIQLKLE